MIFVTHDLGVIADVADDVVVMYAGQIAEQAAAAELFVRPRHPYTEALLDSIPQLTPKGEPLHAIPGMVPRPDRLPSGCRFAPRCSYAQDACGAAPVPLTSAVPTSVLPRTATAGGTDGVVESGPLRPPGRARALRPTARLVSERHPKRSTPARRGDPRAPPVLEVTGLSQGLPDPQRGAAPDDGGGQGRRPGRSAGARRNDAGPGRRKRLGQVDAGPPGPPPHRRHRREDRRRRQGHQHAARPGAASPSRDDAAGVPGSRTRPSTRGRASPTSWGSPWPSTPP